MRSYKKLFERIDELEQAEQHHVARQVGRFLFAMDALDRLEDEDEAIAICQDVFVHHLNTSTLPVDQQAIAAMAAMPALPDNLTDEQKAALKAETERMTYAVAQTISHARQQFRQYLPYVTHLVY